MVCRKSCAGLRKLSLFSCKAHVPTRRLSEKSDWELVGLKLPAYAKFWSYSSSLSQNIPLLICEYKFSRKYGKLIFWFFKLLLIWSLKKKYNKTSMKYSTLPKLTYNLCHENVPRRSTIDASRHTRVSRHAAWKLTSSLANLWHSIIHWTFFFKDSYAKI